MCTVPSLRLIVLPVMLVALSACDSAAMDDAGGPTSDAGGNVDGSAATDAGNVDGAISCAADVADAGWTLCEEGGSCSFVFYDGRGCATACAQLGLQCENAYEDVDEMCAADMSYPALGCAPTGHMSDYCTCRAATMLDAGLEADAGPVADAGSDGGAACPPDRPWECILAEAVGFGGAATGGAGGALCWVENLNARGSGSLRACLDGPAPRWIVFRVSGTIRVNVDVPSDTTIDGRGQRVVLDGAGAAHLLNIGSSSNVFITNLILTNLAGSSDGVHTEAGASDIWLDHLTLSDANDELMGLEGGGVTVSWCHLRDNGYAILAGGGDREYPDLWVTLHHNLFTDNDERHPFTRGRVHMFNNYANYVLSGVRVSNAGQILSEQNIYEASTRRPALQSRAGGVLTVPGYFRSVGDVTRGMAFIDNMGNDPTPVFSASAMYAYTLYPATDALEARVRANAGWQVLPLPMP